MRGPESPGQALSLLGGDGFRLDIRRLELLT
jgi:hypothetical protein